MNGVRRLLLSTTRPYLTFYEINVMMVLIDKLQGKLRYYCLMKLLLASNLAFIKSFGVKLPYQRDYYGATPRY